MAYLIAGVVLFGLVHLAHRIVPGVAAMPEIPRKIVVALLLIASVWLMVHGYGEASAEMLWTVPSIVRILIVILMVMAFILFFSTYPGSALRASMRHPQLTGFKLWAVLHLIANGDVRSLLLFGGLLVWAVVAVILINRQTGKSPLPAASPNTMVAWASIPIGLAVWAVLFLGHSHIFGVSPLG